MDATVVQTQVFNLPRNKYKLSLGKTQLKTLKKYFSEFYRIPQDNIQYEKVNDTHGRLTIKTSVKFPTRLFKEMTEHVRQFFDENIDVRFDRKPTLDDTGLFTYTGDMNHKAPKSSAESARRKVSARHSVDAESEKHVAEEHE